MQFRDLLLTLLKRHSSSKISLNVFVKNESKAGIKQEEIIKCLSKVLPEHMIPRAYVELKEFPLTVNGKLDRKALPDPEFVDQESYIAPTNELERQLCDVWQEVLSKTLHFNTTTSCI